MGAIFKAIILVAEIKQVMKIEEVILISVLSAIPFVGMAQGRDSLEKHSIIYYQFPYDVVELLSDRITAREKVDKNVSLFLESQSDSTWRLFLDEGRDSYAAAFSNRKVLINNQLYDIFFGYDEPFFNAIPDFTGHFRAREICRVHVIRHGPFIVFSEKGFIKEDGNLYKLKKNRRSRCSRKSRKAESVMSNQISDAFCGRIVYYFFDEQEIILFEQIQALQKENLLENRIGILVRNLGGKTDISVVRLDPNHKTSNRYAQIGEDQYEVFFDYDILFADNQMLGIHSL